MNKKNRGSRTQFMKWAGVFGLAMILAGPLQAGGASETSTVEPFADPGGVSGRGAEGHWWVGPSDIGNCHFDNIQDAIDATASLGADWGTISIRLSGPNSLYLGESYTLSLDNFENVTTVRIIGGYEDCTGQSSGTTVLDSDNGTRLFNISNSLDYDGAPREIRLENLVIQGAFHGFEFGGGGILVHGTPGRLSVKLENVTVQDNQALATSGGGGGVMVRARNTRNGGGPMLTADNATIIANNSTNGNGGGVACRSLVGDLGTGTLIRWGAGPIASNQAENGGAISIEGGCSRNFFYNGAFLAGIINNEAVDAGGGIYLEGDGSYISVRGDEFEGFGNPAWRVDLITNEATRGGAVYARDASEVFLFDVNVGGNTAETGGGAIYANAGPAVVTVGRIGNTPCDDSTFGRCSYVRNNAVTSGAGGAFLARNDATINVSNTFVEGNSATVRGSVAAVSGAGPGTVNLESVLATGNHTAPDLLYALHGQIDVRFSTMADNQDLTRAAYAQGFSEAQPGSIGLFSSIFWEDSGIVADEANENSTISGDCVIGWQDPDDLPVSISVYRNYHPMFVSPGSGDYRPGPVSPAIDFCDDSFTQPAFPDLDGNTRGTAHQGSPTRPNPGLGNFDLGAYETDWEELADELFQDRFEGGTCFGFCGGQSGAGCYCDNGCVDFGDCCDSVCQDCPELVHCTSLQGPELEASLGGLFDMGRDLEHSAVRPRRPVTEAILPGS